ncbi:hypothetical protein JTB14_015614 [Gonioctena quinquepunctata]|nr:hypothetical protein JTB14_015614 [Gonioctena quinquepunctata]
MTYEVGQRRLQQIWDEIQLEEEVGGVSSVHSSDDEDFNQDSDHFSDTEQSDVSDNDSDVSVENRKSHLLTDYSFIKLEVAKDG